MRISWDELIDNCNAPAGNIQKGDKQPFASESKFADFQPESGLSAAPRGSEVNG